MKKETKKTTGIVIAATVALLVFFVRPFDLDVYQALTFASVLAVIALWTFNVCSKLWSSAALIVVLLLIPGVSYEKVLSFPLSSTFPMIVLCYLFSRAIRNSGLAKNIFDPLFCKYGSTPMKVIILMIISLFLTILLIPQPLVRLIMLSDIIASFLDRTDCRKDVKEVLLFALYEFYLVVNAAFLKADIIFNTTVVNFAGLDMSNGRWEKLMLVPSLVYLIVVVAVYCFMYRKSIFNIKISVDENVSKKIELPKENRAVAIIVILTIVMWVTKSLHGLSENWVTLAAVVALFAFRYIKLKDIDSIDYTTLMFLTAAYSIGSCMIASGTAAKVFAGIQEIFPRSFSVKFVLIIIISAMGLHLFLGSNTTTLSVAIPSMIVISNGIISPEVLAVLMYISLIPHHYLPFHCLGFAIGCGNNYFKSDKVAKVGAVMTLVIFFAVFAIYMPWWKFLGLL